MGIEGNFNLSPEGKRDMGNPSQFFFTKEEREQKKKEGMTDDEINALQDVITNSQAQARENREAA